MPKFAQGKFNIKNPDKYVGNKTPTYRSSWEFAFMRFCDEHSSVAQWASEAIKIPYRHPFTGKHTVYVPDFFIVYIDKKGKQKVELIEVKPASQSFHERVGKSRQNQSAFVVNQAKWSAANAWCKQKGIFFRIVTEDDIFHQGKRR
ncbi:MAG: TnsA endonuclease N-terminal domain-containing protein [Methylophagaceae bacterium]|jgi:hypothetical protein|tara:strand:- start:1782 stop:2219 length:438 start_codon:yes stop_codon:yes gene_type:complete